MGNLVGVAGGRPGRSPPAPESAAGAEPAASPGPGGSPRQRKGPPRRGQSQKVASQRWKLKL